MSAIDPYSPIDSWDGEEDNFADCEDEKSNSSEDERTLIKVNFAQTASPSNSQTYLNRAAGSSSNLLSSPQTLPYLSLSPTITTQEDERVAAVRSRKREAGCLRKLFSSAIQTAGRVEHLQQLESKTLSLIDSGGIMSVAKRLHSTPDEEDLEAPTPVSDDVDSPGVISVDVKKEPNFDFNAIVAPPGVAVFVNPPCLMETLTAPDLPEDSSSFSETLFNSTPAALHQAIVGEWVTLLYCIKPCPVEILNWLMDVACLSVDLNLREAALRSIIGLLQRALQHSSQLPHFVSYQSISAILVKLGANPDVLNSSVRELETCDQPNAHDTGVSSNGGATNLRIVADVVVRICTILSTVCSICRHSCPLSDVQNLVLLLLKTSLDPAVCSRGLCFKISECLSKLVTFLPNSQQQSLIDWLTNVASTLVSHHRNQLYVVELFSGYSNLRHIQRQLLRLYLWQAISHDGQNDQMDDGSFLSADSMQVPDDELVMKVLNYYCQIKNDEINFDQLRSVGKMLSVYILSQEMRWSHRQLKDRFVNRLSNLCNVRIRDSVLATIQSQVKDLLIRLRMEIQSRNESGVMIQKDLFGFFDTDRQS